MNQAIFGPPPCTLQVRKEAITFGISQSCFRPSEFTMLISSHLRFIGSREISTLNMRILICSLCFISLNQMILLIGCRTQGCIFLPLISGQNDGEVTETQLMLIMQAIYYTAHRRQKARWVALRHGIISGQYPRIGPHYFLGPTSCPNYWAKTGRSMFHPPGLFATLHISAAPL